MTTEKIFYVQCSAPGCACEVGPFERIPTEDTPCDCCAKAINELAARLIQRAAVLPRQERPS